ncbi:MAG: glycosyltransferase [Deltaproteobacteria bacterium]|nr:glycosyltransferase [Deltaproteobacteria bacterium]
MNLLVLNIRVDADHPTQAVTTRWLQSLSGKFNQIMVITVHKGRLDLPENVSVDSLSLHPDDNRILRLIRLYYLFIKILLFKKIHSVFIHQAVVSGALVSWIARLLGKPVLVWYCHQNITPWLRICHLWANGVISSSKDSFRLKSNKFLVTGHGIDTQSFRPAGKIRTDRERFIIGYVGRYSPVKKLEVLIDALEIIVSTVLKPPELHSYGLCQNLMELSYFKMVRGRVREKGLEQFVKFHDPVNNWEVPSLLHGFDLFVSQQETGGTDKAVLEAMSVGLPVVMATTTFNSYLPENLEAEIIFESGSPEEMAKKIKGIMFLQKDKREEIGRIMREIVMKYHSLTRLTETIYMILIKMKNGKDWIDMQERRDK